jgi:hypothetical protein
VQRRFDFRGRPRVVHDLARVLALAALPVSASAGRLESVLVASKVTDNIRSNPICSIYLETYPNLDLLSLFLLLYTVQD